MNSPDSAEAPLRHRNALEPQHVLAVSSPQTGNPVEVAVFNPESEQFAIHLRRVFRERRKWARKNGVLCYRTYDADLANYPFAIDVFCGVDDSEGRTFAYMTDYEPDADCPGDTSYAFRLADAMAITLAALGIPPSRMVLSEHRSLGDISGHGVALKKRITTQEGAYRIELRLRGNQHTGLPLHQRDIRQMIHSMAQGKRFLDLFACAGAATLHAAGGGALTTMTVDSSRANIDWARSNMWANGFEGALHRYVCSDEMQWLLKARSFDFLYDLAYVSPLRLASAVGWDEAQGHVGLIADTAQVIAPGGCIVYACSQPALKLDQAGLADAGLSAVDVTDQVIPHDFEQSPQRRRCYVVSKMQ